MATCTEMVLFFPNTLCKKNDDRTVSIQSPTIRRSVADWLLTVTDYSELVADQSPTDRRSVADRSPTKCQTIAERAAIGRRLIGDWSATTPEIGKQLQWLQRSQSKSVAKRSRPGAVASSVGPGLRTILYSFKLIIHYSLLIFSLIKLLFFIFRTSLFSDHFILPLSQ